MIDVTAAAMAEKKTNSEKVFDICCGGTGAHKLCTLRRGNGSTRAVGFLRVGDGCAALWSGTWQITVAAKDVVPVPLQSCDR
jgi:hypothetical protein